MLALFIILVSLTMTRFSEKCFFLNYTYLYCTLAHLLSSHSLDLKREEIHLPKLWTEPTKIGHIFSKGLSVDEDYDYLWAVHSFDVEKFEFSVVLFLLLSSLCEDSFYWGPARANFDSSLFWNCIFTTEKNSRAGTSNFNTNEFSWTTGNQM